MSGRRSRRARAIEREAAMRAVLDRLRVERQAADLDERRREGRRLAQRAFDETGLPRIASQSLEWG